mgnify:FL=1
MEMNKGKRPVVYIDMDGVLADLAKGAALHPKNIDGVYHNRPDEIEGVFRTLPEISKAVESVIQLYESQKYDLFVLTTAPWGNPSAWIDKRLWIEEKFGEIFKKKIIISHRKDKLVGEFLIDDRLANGAENFKGTHLHFGWDYENEKWNEYPDWESILRRLL